MKGAICFEAGTAASAASAATPPKATVCATKPRHPELHTTMATSNLSRFFKERYRVAIAKFDTERHNEALTQLSELLMEEALPSIYRLKANAALTDGVDDWFLAEQYRFAAEKAYDSISEVVANSATGDEEGLELAALREMLDSLADEQRRDKPSQRQFIEEPSIYSTSRPAKSTTSPADGHAPTAEAQGSQQEFTDSDMRGSLTEVTAQSQSSPGSFFAQGMFAQLPSRPIATPTRTNVGRQMSTSSRRSKHSTPATPDSISKHFSASKTIPRRRSPDAAAFTGSPSKKKRGGAQ
jgi:hypothetical protein